MKKGVERIPHRALFYALGFTDEEVETLKKAKLLYRRRKRTQ